MHHCYVADHQIFNPAKSLDEVWPKSCYSNESFEGPLGQHSSLSQLVLYQHCCCYLQYSHLKCRHSRHLLATHCFLVRSCLPYLCFECCECLYRNQLSSDCSKISLVRLSLRCCIHFLLPLQILRLYISYLYCCCLVAYYSSIIIDNNSKLLFPTLS